MDILAHVLVYRLYIRRSPGPGNDFIQVSPVGRIASGHLRRYLRSKETRVTLVVCCVNTKGRFMYTKNYLCCTVHLTFCLLYIDIAIQISFCSFYSNCYSNHRGIIDHLASFIIGMIVLNCFMHLGLYIYIYIYIPLLNSVKETTEI